MEMLQSKLGSCLDEVTKEKIVKDICSLLANIEFNLNGGVFGGESLVEFAGRIIKKRYFTSNNRTSCEFHFFVNSHDKLKVEP